MGFFIRLRKKRNKLGASLVYAMLIMLVCTVIASVVLAAATAAAGRIIKTGESDRRYYAVNSAVNFIKEIVEEEEFNFKWSYRETKTGFTQITVDYLRNSTYYEEFGEPTKLSEILYETESMSATYWADAKYGTRQVNDFSDIFMNACLDLILGTDRITTEENLINVLPTAWNRTTQVFNSGDTGYSFKITMEGVNESETSEVLVTTSLGSDGKLTMTVTGGGDDSQGSGYTVKLIFRPEVDDQTAVTQSGDEKIGDPTVRYYEGNQITEQNIKRIAHYERSINYVWHLDSVVNG